MAITFVPPNVTEIKSADSSSVDAFGRYRISNPVTLFDSKQIFDEAPLFWNEELESGAGITSAHSTDTASTVITSTLNTAGKFTRQTFMRFNYQPGKSQLILMTGVLDRSGGGTGVERRMGAFDDNNGLFFEDDAGTIGVTRRTNVTGTPVDNTVVQSSWNIDKMDGTGPSGITVDWTKAQLFYIDFGWFGIQRARMGLEIGGVVHLVHEFLSGNILDKVFMSNPNLPLRYQMITTGSSPASTFEAICQSVISEGGREDNGILRYSSTDGTTVNANSAGVIYAIHALRLKTTHLEASVRIEGLSIVNGSNADFEWLLILNPTVAVAVTFADQDNSALQAANGNAGNPSTSTVTGGVVLAGGYVVASGSSGDVTIGISNARLLGAAIDGTRDEIYLCMRPLTPNANAKGGITRRELS